MDKLEIETRSEIVNDIAARLRVTQSEYPGALDTEKTVIITGYDLGERVCGFRHVFAPTGIGNPLLGNMDNYKAASDFMQGVGL